MANQSTALTKYLNSDVISTKLIQQLGAQKATALKSTLIQICDNNRLFDKCDPRSIVGAAFCAVANNLSLTPSLGQAYIVPYGDKAMFQVGWRGLVQLALRTGKYQALHAGKVYEGEFAGINPFTGEPERGDRFSDKIIGYVAYMRLSNGFEKYLYMTVEELQQHAIKYSKSYSYDQRSGKQSSVWTTNFDAMATKTVLKLLLNRWGILSAEMLESINADQSVVDKDTFEYVDNGGNIQKRDTIYTADDAIDVTPTQSDIPSGGDSSAEEPF